MTPGAQPAPPMTAGAAPQPAMAYAPAATIALEPQLPRWGVQTGFFQRRQPAFWLFVVLFVLTALTVISEQIFYLRVFPAGWFFSILLLALYVVPVVVAIYILDLFEREPLSLIVAAFLWGGVIAVGLAVVVNTSLFEILAKLLGPTFTQTWGAAIVAPLSEETFKFLGVVVIYLIARSEIDDLFDGFVYGAVVGLGFAAVENVQYFIQAVASAGGGDQLGPVLNMFIVRGLLVGAYMHVLWTALTGLGLAYYVTQRHEPRQKRLMYAIGLFLVAVLAHFIWNSPLFTDLLGGFGGIVVFGLIKGLPFLVFLGLLVVLAQRREHRWFQTLTAAHVGDDVLTPAEVSQLGSLRSRWQARREIGRRKGPQAGRLAAQLQREQINLAMIRSRAGRDDDPSVLAQVDRIRALRAQLNAMPDVQQPFPAYPAQPGVAPGQPGMAPAQPGMAPAQTAAAPAQPATAVAPAQPAAVAPVAPAMPTAWVPTNFVPPTGMAAWAAPDPTQPPVAQLAPGVQLTVLDQQGAWARVMGSNGWTGWVDGRLLGRFG